MGCYRGGDSSDEGKRMRREMWGQQEEQHSNPWPGSVKIVECFPWTLLILSHLVMAIWFSRPDLPNVSLPTCQPVSTHLTEVMMVYSLGHLIQCQSPVKYACCHKAELQQNSKNVVEVVEDQVIKFKVERRNALKSAQLFSSALCCECWD